MHIGPIELPNRLFVAPMAGVTDRPFRQLCKRLGAGYAVSEMVTSRKRPVGQPEDLAPRRPRRRGGADRGADRRRRPDDDGRGRALQRRARRADHRHQHGLPGQEGVQQWAGSALMQDEPLALAIVEAVVAACAPRGVPVTLKMRTGWAPARRNAVRIARAAEAPASRCSPCTAARASRATRATPSTTPIAAVKARGAHPGRRQRRHRHAGEGARGAAPPPAPTRMMIGRAAQGRPWIFREIAHFLATGEHAAAAARRARSQRWLRRAPRRPLRAVRRGRRRAQRAQAHRLGACAACPAARSSARA